MQFAGGFQNRPVLPVRCRRSILSGIWCLRRSTRAARRAKYPRHLHCSLPLLPDLRKPAVRAILLECLCVWLARPASPHIAAACHMPAAAVCFFITPRINSAMSRLYRSILPLNQAYFAILVSMNLQDLRGTSHLQHGACGSIVFRPYWRSFSRYARKTTEK